MSMSDDEEFQNVDTGASNTIPTPCGALRKGGYVMLKGYPCKVIIQTIFIPNLSPRSWICPLLKLASMVLLRLALLESISSPTGSMRSPFQLVIMLMFPSLPELNTSLWTLLRIVSSPSCVMTALPRRT